VIDWLKRAPIEPEIELGGRSVPIILRRHPTAKRLTLRLAPDGSEVRITLPRWARAGEAMAFAHARQEWLERQHARIPERKAPRAGGDLIYRGKAVRIEWDEATPRRPRLEGATLRVGGAPEGLEGRIRRWLEGEALALIEGDLAGYLAAAGLEPVPIGLSRAQKRWGSCSDGGKTGQRRIRINWRLVQAPDFVRRSVVAHEVAHLVHFDHSPAFHALLGRIFEGDIGEADRWLKVRGRTLYSAFG
jgi:predicted metal-dependent hydrolase